MWVFGRKWPRGFSAFSTAEEVTQGIDGTGLTAIVTGASRGIGEETTRVLALRGVHVVMAVRNVEAGRNVRETILKENPSAMIDVMELDLSSMASTRKFASEYKSSGLPLNLLINNAGIVGQPFMLSEDGIELHFATNHLGHFLLTSLMLETMKNTARQSNREGRIINVSSIGHRCSYGKGIRFDKINDEPSYNCGLAYTQSKLCNILHANELTRRLKEDGVDVTANSLHPGVIHTDIMSHNCFYKGIMGTPFTLSEDGIELQFATNHLGHFLLTSLLLETMKNTARQSNREGRIINVSSVGHRCTYSKGIRFDKINDEPSYKTILAYGQSKLCNILHTNELTRCLKEDGVDVTANSLHPGAVATEILSHNSLLYGIGVVIGIFLYFFVIKNVQQGAATTCYVALHPQVKGVSGEYFSDCKITQPSSKAKDAALAKKLWDFSLSLTTPE